MTCRDCLCDTFSPTPYRTDRCWCSHTDGSHSGKAVEEHKYSVKNVRQCFIDFFQDKYEHTYVPSSPCVPHNDPTLLFANSGMNQFKPIFVGDIPPGSEMANWKRAVNSQKCIRAGGKHNDLEDVGKDTYHHTFFEMLGNWSFGDFFKKEIIAWAWEILTEVFGLEPQRLYATYFEGDASQGLEPDLEARDLWLTILPPSHVIPGNAKDNFWEMGDIGPCGPCSELHYDRVGGREVPHLVNMDDPNVLEIWNLVFMQFERTKDGLKKLPHNHVDTGMGLERLVSVLQDKPSNYDTDVFGPIFDAIQKVCGCRDYTGLVGDDDKDHVDMAYRVVADHIRTLTFALSDGAVPSSLGRGYVLRRILRRAVRYGTEVLGGQQGFLHTLVPCVVDHMGDAFPEIRIDPASVISIIQDEEEVFGRTLVKGLAIFNKFAGEVKNGVFPGNVAFKLYDTFGFPIDLTELMCDEKKLKLDMEGYEEAMESQRVRSRGASGTGEGVVNIPLDTSAVTHLSSTLSPTDDSAKFTGDELTAEVLAIYDTTAKGFVDEASPNTLVGVVLDRTNFYAEQGGQIFDTGVISTTGKKKKKSTVEIENSQVYSGYVLHIGTLKGGKLKKGAKVDLALDTGRRAPIMMHHTATHMVNYGLRNVLGDHVQQKGSLVVHDKLRFDYSQKKPLNAKQAAAVEEHVRRQIREKLPVHAKVVSRDDAMSINGLQKVFGETYPDPVRVVSVGVPVEDLLANPTNPEWAKYSIEFCGGTHLGNAAEAEAFALVSDEGVAGGVRRIIGLCGEYAKEAISRGRMMEQRVVECGKLDGQPLVDEVARLSHDLDTCQMPMAVKFALRDEMHKLVGKVKKVKGKNADKGSSLFEEMEKELTGDETLVVRVVDLGLDGKVIDRLCKSIIGKCKGAHVLLLSTDGSSTKAIAAAPKKGALKAGDWVKELANQFGGRGGGKPTNAQAQVESGDTDALMAAANAFAKKAGLGS